MTYLESELNFDQFTGRGIKLYLGAIVFALLDIFTNNMTIIENLTWNQISFTCFILGIAYTYRIVQNWLELHKYTKNILDR